MKQDNRAAFIRLRMFVSLVIALPLLPACSSNPFHSESTGHKQGRVITVTSSPPGATVRADDKVLGKTPLQVDIDKSFPHRWVQAEDYGIVYRVSGKLVIENNGCEEYSVPVSRESPAEDIDVILVCSEQKPVPAPARATEPVMPESMEQRLRKLEKLYRDGVISADEYHQHRNRILDEL